MSEIFGTIIDGSTIEQAVLTALKAWVPTYIVEIERQRGMTPVGRLIAPREWRIVNELDAPTGPKQFPAVWLVSAGLDGEPDEFEDTFSASWLVSVAVIVSAKDQEHTVRLARLYTAAIRAALTHKPPVTAGISRVRWVDEAYDRGPLVLENTTAYGTLVFRVTADDVLARTGGPADPLPSPLPDPVPDNPGIPTVSEIDLDLEPVASSDDLP